ncbi:prolyl oligopeptidase family serine peptidase [Corynebacterium sp. 4HC-13]|uniref:alpha/beta hydrolase family protein n=1 Tax=Corynebacterium anserum TaxID=2684406 RepID=UPI00163A66A7|nr:alpha/beta hydrolase [Corynebacterium anserum]MBC2681188.1 prolyl oligopeptidase family serine peptidase [Corynebacterium anserum]
MNSIGKRTKAVSKCHTRRAALCAVAVLTSLGLAACSGFTHGSDTPRIEDESIEQTAQLPRDGIMRFHYATEHERQYGDLFLPRGQRYSEPVPLVVMIHGGGWMEKSDAASTNDLAENLTTYGVAVWNIEYRGIGKEGQPGPGGWPRTYEDVAQAVDFIPTLAERSAVPLDLTRVTVTGLSAGGNLSAWSCSRPALPNGAPGSNPRFVVNRCVGLAGVYDLKLAYEQHDRYVKTLLGGTPDEVPDRYRLSSPAENINKDATIVVFAGRNDEVVNYDEATSFVKEARAAGLKIEEHILNNASHVSWAKVTGPQWKLARTHILAQVGIKAENLSSVPEDTGVRISR